MSTNPLLLEHGLVFLGDEESRAARHVDFDRRVTRPLSSMAAAKKQAARKCPTVLGLLVTIRDRSAGEFQQDGFHRRSCPSAPPGTSS
ncbi:hypothetical protein PG997_006800 [Apiospora hydei]|uniref:Uncharacterized protein n=1 Tax=Apiospora hydei TaxID=1337664 RepID=A0ABR1WPS5_9PEZI